MEAGVYFGSVTTTLFATGLVSSAIAAGGITAALTFGGVIVVGALAAYGVALALDYIFTELKINGKTIEDWITFWN
jgi:predicted methyltransferase MtxX (methanogen marker protein 4)